MNVKSIENSSGEKRLGSFNIEGDCCCLEVQQNPFLLREKSKKPKHTTVRNWREDVK